MTDLPVAEMFYSLQGEGPHTGQPAVFLRLANCNLRCGAVGRDLDDVDPLEDEPTEGASWVCVAEGEEVYLANGKRKNIENVEEGDVVVTRPLNASKRIGEDVVVKTGSKGVQDVFEITLENGRSVRATLDHEFYRQVEVGTERVAVEDIGPGDKLHVVPEPDTVNRDELWKIGYLSGIADGDGWHDTYSRKTSADNEYEYYKLEITTGDDETKNFVVNLLEEFGLDPSVYDKKAWRVDVVDSDGLEGDVEKMCNVELDEEQIARGYLAGMYDADGHEKGLRISQKPGKEEYRRIQKALEQVGIDYEVKVEESANGILPLTSEREFYEETAPVLDRKFRFLERFEFQPVESVEPAGQSEVYDIETKNSKKFVCEGFETKNCDSIPVWKEADHTYSPQELANEFDDRGFTEHLDNGAHIVLTGGEPTLPQSQEGFVEFYDVLTQPGLDPFVEVETNGTIMPDSEFNSVVNQYNVSLKLSNSGHDEDRRLDRDVIDWHVWNYLDTHMMTGMASVFKFVVGDESDVQEVESIVDEYVIPEEMVSLMPAGQTREQLKETYPLVADVVKEKNWRFSPRLHISVWNMQTGV